MEKNNHPIDPKSLVTHWPKVSLEKNNWPLVDPIYLSTKFTMDSLSTLENILSGKKEGYFYSRRSNPTVRQLELLLAQLQGREDAMAVGSGIAALSSCFLSLLSAGDHIVYFLESYRPTRCLIKNILAKFGVTSTMTSVLDFTDPTKPSPIQSGKTKLIIFESPTNPMTFIQDLAFITQEARKHGILTLMDNTFAGFHQHGEFPIDIFIHSLTKYSSGHGDGLGGVIISSKELIARMKDDVTDLGPSIDPHGAYLILRGMKTYFLRYEAQSRNAEFMAQALEQHPLVEGVLYPFLPSHPQNALAKQQMKNGGGIISFHLKHAEVKTRPFIENLQMIKLAASLGSTESMVAPVELLFAGDLTEEQKKKAGIRPNSIRFSVGIEDKNDILKDLYQALDCITR